MTVDRSTYPVPSPGPKWALGAVLLAPLLAGAGGKTGDLEALFDDPAAAAYRAAREALAADRPKAALEALAEARGLDDYGALLEARAHAALGKAEAALAALGRVKPRPAACDAEPLLFVETRALIAEISSGGAPAKAAEALLALPPSGEILDRARTLLKAADAPQAKKVTARLLVEVPESPEARRLARSLGPKGVAALLSLDERKRRAMTLLATHQNEAALRESQALLSELGEKDGAACRLAYAEGKSLRKLRRYSGAIKALDKARRLCLADGDETYALRASLLLAHVRGIRRQVAGTKEIAEFFLKKHPDHRYADDAMLVHAHVLERRGLGRAAKKIYRRIVEELPNGDEAPSAAWRLAFQAIQDEEPDRAESLLRWILERDVTRPVDHARARYWLARVLEKQKKTKEAKPVFERLVKEPSFYGWLGLSHLARKDPAAAEALRKSLLQTVRAEAAALPLPERIVNTEEHRRARLLFGAGEPELAAAELARLSCGDLSREEALALALSFDRIGAHPEAQLVLRSRKKTFLTKPLVEEDVPVWRVAYSRPYLEEVRSAASEEKLEPLFLLALVREESTFDPEIVSWAGATGLAQLMPATAVGAYANVYNRRLKDMDRLTDPKLNLRLGAHVLKAGLARWKNTEALALSAYNGGHRLTKNIIPDDETDFELWVEQIPVKETRRYVKRVIETWGIYRLLYDAERPFIELPARIGGPGWK